jgi:hypothetical protein
LLDKAAQPRHASGNACIKLCYFVEQCRNSKASKIQESAFSENTSLKMFNFYIEWNEKNQHRSMRQVLEVLNSLISLNPDEDSSDAVTKAILQRVLSIITHQAAQPLVKPAFKSLESFLGKGTISTGALIDCYEKQIAATRPNFDVESGGDSFWDSFMSEVFEWLTLPDISPATGKFLVTLFVKLRNESKRSFIHTTNHSVLWQRWIRNGLSKNPETLENVKNYLLPHLFKLDRPGSMLFLSDLNSQGQLSGLQIRESNAHSLLHLAAIEVGKKSGLVEEPSMNLLSMNMFYCTDGLGTLLYQKDSKKATIVLEESAVGDLLTHTLDTVRSLAFSVLVSSSSSIRPFSTVALNLLQACMEILYADTDAKFRNEILSNTRHMIERLRGAIAYLTRELENIKFLVYLNESADSAPRGRKQELSDEISGLLRSHEKFIQWYLDFLSGELIPTASYQRHITALKATTLLLNSGILEHDPSRSLTKGSDNATIWPFTIKFFTPGTMRLVMDLLMDPFEDVRISASVLLKLASHEDFRVGTLTVNSKGPNGNFSEQGLANGETNRHSSHLPQLTNSLPAPPTRDAEATPRMLLNFIYRAQAAAKRTGRADYADGVARSYEVLYCLSSSMDTRLEIIEQLVEQLELKVVIVEEDLARAVLEAPIHGSFAALKYV